MDDPQVPAPTVPVPIQPTSYLPAKPNFWVGFVLATIIASLGGLYLKYLYAPKTPAATKATPTGTPSAIPTADPIADWKTYRDPKNRFSFKYPNTMLVENFDTNRTQLERDNIFFLETPEHNLTQGYSIEFSLSGILKGGNIPPEKWMRQVQDVPEYDFIDTQKEITLNGIRTVIRTYVESWKAYKTYYLYSANLSLEIRGTGPDHTLFDQILSTFQFLN